MSDNPVLDEFPGPAYAVWQHATQAQPDKFFGPWIPTDDSPAAEDWAWKCAHEYSIIRQRQGHATTIITLAEVDLLDMR